MGQSIDNLNISNKAKIRLHAYGIDEVQQLNELNLEDFRIFRGVGEKTYLEVKRLLKKVDNEQFFIEKLRKYSKNDLMQMSLYPIETLNLSNRPYNRLKELSITTLSELALLKSKDLKQLEGLGSKSLNEIYAKFKDWLENNFDQDKDDYSVIDSFYSFASEKINNIIPISKNGFFHICKNNNIDYIDFKDSFVSLLQTKEIIQMVKETFINKYPDLIVEKANLEEELSTISLNLENFSLVDYFCEYIVDSLFNYYILKNESIESYLYRKYEENSEDAFILYKRIIENNSLQKIAEIKNVSRERIRQIIIKKMKNVPLLREDCYKLVFEYFNFNESQFTGVFNNETFITYNYLFAKYKKGKKEITIETVNDYTGYFKKEILEYLNRIEEKYTRTKISIKVLMNECEAISEEIFKEKYDQFIEKNGLDADKFKLNIRTVINRFRSGKYIVFNNDDNFRYIDIDYEAFCNLIDLSKYEHSLISADLVYKDNIELMNDFDIRDGHEAFYVLKDSKNLGLLNQYNIDFRRVPTIIFDDMDDETQVLSFLKDISPVSSKDFYQLYEDQYGFKKESSLGNLSKYLNYYYVNGNYVIDAPYFNENDSEILKRKLCEKSYWFIDEIEKLVVENCDVSAKDAINHASLKRIGYNLYPSGFILSDKYNGIFEYLENEIFNKNLVDTNKIDKRITNLSIFGSFVSKKKEELEIIEIDKRVFYSINYFLELYSLSKEELINIQNVLLSYCTDVYFNGYTIRENIKESKLIPEKLKHDLLINSWMTSCLMRQKEGIFSFRISDDLVLSRNSNNLNVPLICKWIERDSGKLSISQLSNKLNGTFGFNYSKANLAEKIRTKGMWNEIINDSLDSYIDELMEKVSLDDEDLLEENFY